MPPSAAIRLAAACLLACLALPSARAADPAADAPLQPSANKGRAGKYHVDLTKTGYGYWIQVPSTYSDANPAGIHIFFHGQHGQGGAEWFGGWEGPFLQKYNLIGINMQYMDGDNGHDTPGKVAAARKAIAQTIADYKVVVGRGVICSFSGGGLPHALFANESSKTRGPAWPFCHDAIYSSNYRTDAAQGCLMSWYIGVGTAEWNLAGTGLGMDACRRTGEIYTALAKGACPDIHFKIIKDKGHTILDADVAESSRGFARSDLAFAPFLYTPDYAEPELRGIVNACAALQLGPALSAIEKLKAKPAAAEALKAKAGAIAALIAARIERMKAIAQQLADDDAVLAGYYLPLYAAQCRGTPAEKELKEAMQRATKDKGFQSTLAGHAEFIKLFPQLLAGGGSSPDVVPDKVGALDAIVKVMKPASQTGTMAAEILALKK
jgi:hypothetical protein